MDTRSSSGSGSHSTSLNFIPTLNQDRPRASQHATYTTAGTVYNPQTAPPLQPPARRGRASRWPPANSADLSNFNNSVLGTFTRTRYRSPPTTASTLKHYSPLQQNQDRAIDPRYPADQHRPATSENDMLDEPPDVLRLGLGRLSTALPRELPADELTKSIVCNVCGERFQTTASADFHATLSGHATFSVADNSNENTPNGDTFPPEEEMKEEEDLTQFNNYSVKTLTNLASYPNPNQKLAQRCLDRARETFRAAAEKTRPASNNSSRPSFNGGCASSSSYFSGSGRESSEFYSRVPRNAHMHSSTRSSVLSNGPGAPQPLTAGPPGQRHYKASTLEGPLRALQESPQKPHSLALSESLLGTNPPNLSVLSGLSRPASTRMSEASRDAEQETKATIPLRRPSSPLPMEKVAPSASCTAYRNTKHHSGTTVSPNQQNIWTNGMLETKAQDDLSEYYPGSRGFVPFDYNPATLVTVSDDNSDLQHPTGRALYPRLESQEQRDADLAHHRKRFYAGDCQVFRAWECRFDKIHNKVRDWELGTVNNGETLTSAQIEASVDPSQLGKPRNISVSLISQLQPHDAARPLLSMLYSTLANLKNGSQGVQMPQQRQENDRWVGPRPGYIGQEREEWMRVQANRARPQTPFREENPRW